MGYLSDIGADGFSLSLYVVEGFAAKHTKKLSGNIVTFRYTVPTILIQPRIPVIRGLAPITCIATLMESLSLETVGMSIA